MLREKYGEVDRDALVVKLLLEEFNFTTVEVTDLPALKSRQRDWGKVYLLGESHFDQTRPSASVDMTTLTPKVKRMRAPCFVFFWAGVGWDRAKRAVPEPLNFQRGRDC